MQKILFIGATGMLGKPVARQLIKTGFDVTLLVRDEKKSRSLFPRASVINGDLYNKQTLVKAMQGQQAVYMNLSVAQQSRQKDLQPEREGIDNIIAAAKETGIQRLVYLSSLVHFYNGMNNFSWWAFDIKQSAVTKIKAAGIPYTIFYPSTFMETFPYQMMQGNKIALLGKSEMPMWFIAAEDYARQVAKSFTMATTENREYVIQGEEPYTFDEAGKIFIENYSKKKLKMMGVPIGLIKLLGNFSSKLNYGWHICEALNKYPEKFESEQTWKDLGTPETSLAKYAKSLK